MHISLAWWAFTPTICGNLVAAVAVDDPSTTSPQFPTGVEMDPSKYTFTVPDTETTLKVDTTFRIDPEDLNGVLQEMLLELHNQPDKDAPIPPYGHKTTWPIEGPANVIFQIRPYRERQPTWHVVQDTLSGLLKWAVNGSIKHPWAMNIRVSVADRQVAIANIISLRDSGQIESLSDVQ